MAAAGARLPLRVLHLGDLHLGVELYGRPDAAAGYGSRVADFLAALDRALALAADVDLVLFPGDVYKNCDPSPTIQREFARRVLNVARERPVVLIPGNHDLPHASGRASSVDIFHVLEVANVHVLRQPRVQAVETGRGTVLVAPLPFLPRSRLFTQEETRAKTLAEVTGMIRSRLVEYLFSLRAQVTELRGELGEETPAILLAHWTISGAVYGGYGRGALLAPEVELPPGDVRDPVFDYVALGHIHRHQTIPPDDHEGQPPVVYPGSLERVDFGEEEEEKVVVLAEVARRKASWRPAPVHPRPFLTIRVKADDADPLTSVKAGIAQYRERIPGAVVRLYYTLGPGHPNLPERELRAALEGAYVIAGIRRDTPLLEERRRLALLSAERTPLEALQLYLDHRTELAPHREELLALARPLIAEQMGQGGE